MNGIPRTFGSRRRFLKQMSLATLASLPAGTGTDSALAWTTARAEPTHFAAAVRNRAPLAQSAFYSLPLGSIRPIGWLRDQLRIQATGLSGHLDETWKDVDGNSGWLGGSGESWERGPYFLDGLVPLAYLLNDERLKAKAQRFVEWTLVNQSANGMLGPTSNEDWWPRMVMLKALIQYQETTGDLRVIPAMSRYCTHQLSTLPGRPLKDWGKFRWQDNALAVVWLYNRTGDTKLLQLLELLHKQGYDWQAQFADFKYTQPITPEYIKLNDGGGLGDLALATHGVNNGQALKASPLWSLVSNKEEDRRALQRQLNALDKFHGLPNGMFSCDEHFAGLNPSQGTELCTVVETMFSLEVSLAILGDATLGDRLERIAFNALPGTFTDDMWAHQYNQEPNQVECSLHRKPWTTDGPESNLFGLEPNFGCCTANFHQGWPKFAASLWMASQDDGLVAAAYSPCEVDSFAGGTRVHLIEETEYPFRGAVGITVSPATAARFPLSVRIPSWAEGATIKVNGKREPTPAVGTFAQIDRVWKPGDRVELNFPTVPRLTRGYNGSISIARGALVFSYPIGESWVKLQDRGLTADWQIFPASQWNYALAVNDETIKGLPVQETTISASPFSRKGSPVKLQVMARKVPAWRAEDGVANPVPSSPVTSDEPEEKITLLPYAAAKLRITAFPQLRS